MQYEKPSPLAIKSWRVSRLIRTAFFVLGAVIIPLIMRLAEAPRTMFIATCTVLGCICLYSLISAFVFPLIEYRQWGYRIEEDKVVIRHGIFFIRTVIIPMIRIQNVTIGQGPIDRHYRLCHLELALATGSYDIRCLPRETAEEISGILHQRLYRRIDKRGVL